MSSMSDKFQSVIICNYFSSEEVDCEEPIVVVSHKIGVCRVATNGKPCRTVFTRINYNGKSSVVKCKSMCMWYSSFYIVFHRC